MFIWNAHRDWKPGEKIPLGKPRRRWEDNINKDHRDIGWGGMD
jgi:hypothetical protein